MKYRPPFFLIFAVACSGFAWLLVRLLGKLTGF